MSKNKYDENYKLWKIILTFDSSRMSFRIRSKNFT